jgi:hypothetical protein
MRRMLLGDPPRRRANAAPSDAPPFGRLPSGAFRRGQSPPQPLVGSSVDPP